MVEASVVEASAEGHRWRRQRFRWRKLGSSAVAGVSVSEPELSGVGVDF